MSGITIFVVAEDSLAQCCATHLLDRVVAETVGALWLRELWQEEQRSNARTFVELHPKYQTRVPSRLRGKAKDAYRALHAARAEREKTEGDVALLLAFDSDHLAPELTMRFGLSTVGQEEPAIATVLAEASPEFDAWILLGHEPKPKHEQEALEEVCAQLTFDPRERPHDLNSTTGNDRDAKRVCQKVLCLDGQAGPFFPRVLDALDAPLELMVRRGKLAGVPEFLDDIAKRLLPVIGD